MKTKIWMSALAVMVGASTLLGAPILSLIPTLGTDTTNSGRAITPDGQYVVGQSGTATGFLYPVATGNTINVISSDNAQATIATGVGYRTSGGNTELIIAGMSMGTAASSARPALRSSSR